MTKQTYTNTNYPHVVLGADVPVLGNSSKSVYRVVEVDAKGFTLIRLAKQSRVRVTWKKVDRIQGALESASRLFQGNFSRGGIDGTSATRDAILWAVGAVRDGDRVKLASAAQGGAA